MSMIAVEHIIDQVDHGTILLVDGGVGVNDAVELIPDLVLDQEVHVLMHLGEGGIRVHSVVIGNDNTNQSLYY